jgi:hypothetical protein
MAMKLMETAEEATTSMEMAPRALSPSRQGARTENLVPQNSSVAATGLQDFFSKNTE